MAFMKPSPKKDGTVSYVVRWRDPDSPKVDKRCTLTFDDPDQAKRTVDFLNANGQRLSDASRVMATIDATVPTVAETIERHISDLSGITDRTRADYRRDARRHILPHLGRLPIDAVDRPRIRQWVNTLAPTMSGKTLANVHGLLSATFTSAVADYGLRPDNPCRGVRMPDYMPAEMVFLSSAEFALLLAHIPKFYQPFVQFLAGTGMRWGEATALTVNDFALTSSPATVRVTKAWKRDENCQRWFVGPPKTPQARRTVSLGDGLVAAILPRIRGKAGDDLVFTGPQGGRLHNDHFRQRQWSRAVKAATSTHDANGALRPAREVLTKTPRIHDLRHTHASDLIARNLDMLSIQRRLGHKSITTTSDRYGHLGQGQLEATAVASDAALGLTLPQTLRVVS